MVSYAFPYIARRSLPNIYIDASRAVPNAVAMQHITESSSCVNFGTIRVGDMVEVRAMYNTSAHYMNRNIMHEPTGIASLFGSPEITKFA